MYFHFLNKGLNNVYIIKLSIHKNDRPHGIVKKKDGIIISIIFSLFAQLDNVTLS